MTYAELVAYHEQTGLSRETARALAHAQSVSNEPLLTSLDPFVGVNGQGTVYAETPCWSVLAMPVPDVHSEECEERRRQERRMQRLF